MKKPLSESEKPAPRDGKDEMNLVEHPFAVLSSTGDARAVIELQWEAERGGKAIKCSWR